MSSRRSSAWAERRSPLAATNYGLSELRFNLIGSNETSAAAQAALPDERLPEETIVKASNLDPLLASKIEAGALLKLDLQGHEIPALRGATQLLDKVEVVIIEASFYQVNDNQRPVFADLYSLLVESAFELYDIATLVGRAGDNRLQGVTWSLSVWERADHKQCMEIVVEKCFGFEYSYFCKRRRCTRAFPRRGLRRARWRVDFVGMGARVRAPALSRRLSSGLATACQVCVVGLPRSESRRSALPLRRLEEDSPHQASTPWRSPRMPRLAQRR
jgi:hypothetical protein